MIKYHKHFTQEHITETISKTRFEELQSNLCTVTEVTDRKTIKHSENIFLCLLIAASIMFSTVPERLYFILPCEHLDLRPYRSARVLPHNEPRLVCLTTAFENRNQVIAVCSRHRGESKDPKPSLTFCPWVNFNVAQLLAAKNLGCINCFKKEKEEGGSQGLHHYVLLRLLYTYSCRKGFWLRQL